MTDTEAKLAARAQALLQRAARDGKSRIVVGAAIWRDGILLMRRKSDDFLGGLWEIPSGKLNEGETLFDCAKREVLEETGQVIDSLEKYLGYFDYTSQSGRETRQLNFTVAITNWSCIVLTEHDAYEFIAESQKLTTFKISTELAATLNLVLAGRDGKADRGVTGEGKHESTP